MASINMTRLLDRLDRAAQIGQDPAGGITRPFGSEAERRVRRWFVEEATAAGFTPHVDAAGNLWAVHPGKRTRPAFAMGSHLDTVSHGGPMMARWV
ncbi:MAG: hypothetical protein M0Z53_05190 [Thermaerobacter sp.]|nr:hypothetical protein [Thermaerobacter sp.]